jgi:hypothetical protein
VISANTLRDKYLSSTCNILNDLEPHLISCASLGHSETTLGCSSNSDYYKHSTVWEAGPADRLWVRLKHDLELLGYDVSYCYVTARTKISW